MAAHRPENGIDTQKSGLVTSRRTGRQRPELVAPWQANIVRAWPNAVAARGGREAPSERDVPLRGRYFCTPWAKLQVDITRLSAFIGHQREHKEPKAVTCPASELDSRKEVGT